MANQFACDCSANARWSASSGANPRDAAIFRRLQNRSHRLGLTPDSLQSCIIERALETADVEIDDFAHAIIVTSAPSSAPDGELEIAQRSGARRIARLGQSLGNDPCGESKFIPNAVLFYVVTTTINT